MLGFLIIAITTTISSENLWSFMRQPESEADSYDADVLPYDTFGSPDRTNGSHRVTGKTRAAIETLFEAFYERAFFSSEGLSNNWNEAEFGPQALTVRDLANVSFDETNGGDRISFRYLPRERIMPETHRLVETMTNLPNAYPTMLKDLIEKPQPLLNRGDTWKSSDRKLWWLCSGFQFSKPPTSFDWSWKWPKNNVATLQSLVPINAFGSYSGAKGWPCDDRMHQSIAVREWLDPVHDPLIQRNEDRDRAFSLPGHDHVYGDYQFITNSATEEMALLYGNQTNAVYGEFTRRLVPDEYIESVDVEVETNFVEVLAYMTDEDKRTLEAWEPWLGIQPYYDGRYIEYAYTDERIGITPSRRINIPVSSRQAVWPPYDESFISVTLDESSVPDPDALESINSYGGFGIGAFSYTASNRVVVSGKWENVYDPFVLEGVKLTYKTNSITKGISYLAAASRILAAHDRTFEIPVYNSEAEYGLGAANIIETWIATNNFVSSGSVTRRFKIKVNPKDGTFRFDPKVNLASLTFRNNKTSYTNIFEREAIAHNYDTAWFVGGTEEDYARVNLDIGGSVRAEYEVSTEDIIPTSVDPGPGVFAKIISSYDQGTDTYTYGFEFDNPIFDDIFPVRCETDVMLNATSNLHDLAGDWNMQAKRRCILKYSVFPPETSPRWRNLFTAYAPGPLGISRVDNIQAIFASSVVVDHINLFDTYDNVAVEPPFSFNDIVINHPHHMIPTVFYRMNCTNEAPAGGRWVPGETFPMSYAMFRSHEVEHKVREILPDEKKIKNDIIKIDLYENISLDGIPDDEKELEWGTIDSEESDARIGNGRPVYISFSHSDDGPKCYDFYFYTGEEFHTDRIPFGVLFALSAKALGHAALSPKADSASATGRTAAGIVTDWDWNALKLKHEDRD